MSFAPTADTERGRREADHRSSVRASYSAALGSNLVFYMSDLDIERSVYSTKYC